MSLRLMDEASSTDLPSIMLSSNQYDKLCETFQARLDELLSKEMTELYAQFSHLFTSFKKTFMFGLKLSNKLFEIESQNRTLERNNNDLEKVIDERDEKIKQLEDSILKVDSMRFGMELQEKKFHKVIEELKEEAVKEKMAYEELLKSQSEGGARQKLEEANTKIELLNQELLFERKREEILQKRSDEEDKVGKELKQEIINLQKKLKDESRERINAESNIYKKDREIEKHLKMAESYKGEIEKIQFENEGFKSHNESLSEELRRIQKSLQEKNKTIEQLSKNLGSQKFHSLIFKRIKQNLEQDAQEKKEQILSLKFEQEKNSKMKQNLNQKIKFLEQRNEELRNSIQRIRQQYDAKNTKKEFIVSQSNMEDEDEKVIALRKEILHLKEDLSKAQEAIDLSASKAIERDNQIHGYKIETKKNADEISNLKHNLLNSEIKINNLNFQISRHQNAEKSLMGRIKTLEQLEREAEIHISKLTRQLKKTQEGNISLHQSEYEARKDSHSTKEQMDNIVSSRKILLQMVSKQRLTILDYEDSVSMLKSEVEQAKNKYNKNKSLVKILKDRVASLSKEQGMLRNELDKVLKSLNEKDRANHSLEQKLNFSAESRQICEAQLNEKMREVENKDEKIRLYEAERANLVKDLLQKDDDIKLLNFKWRIVGGTEEDLTVKISTLRKQLAMKIDSLKAKEQELQEKDQLIKELRSDIQKRSELMSEEKLWLCQKNLKSCRDQVKSLAAERNMYQSQMERYEREKDQLTDELRKLKMLNYKRNI
nr:girdin-like [Parasteatoda tepidariorum]